jgi:spore germination protein GerM
VSRQGHRPFTVLFSILAVTVTAAGVSACGIPTSATPTAIAKTAVPFRLLNPVTPTTAPSTVPPAVAVPETIFLVAPSQTLFAVTRNVVTRDVQVPATLGEVLGALLEGPTAAESDFGLQSFLAKSTVTATVTGGIATVDFTTDPVQVVGPDQTLAIAQVVYTATQSGNGVTGVVFQIGGHPISVPTASGVQVTGPVGRSSYGPQAPAA